MTKTTRKMRMSCIPQGGCLDAVLLHTCLYNCFTSCDSALVSLAVFTWDWKYGSMMLCHVVLFRLKTLFVLHYHYRTLQKGRTANHRAVQSPWATQENASAHLAPCPPLVPCLWLHWALVCHSHSEVVLAFSCKLHRYPTGSSTAEPVLNWLIFLAAQAMCWLCFPPTYLGWRLSWQLLIPAFDGGIYRQYIPLQHPHPAVVLLYCMLLSGNSSGSFLAPTIVRI